MQRNSTASFFVSFSFSVASITKVDLGEKLMSLVFLTTEYFSTFSSDPHNPDQFMLGYFTRRIQTRTHSARLTQATQVNLECIEILQYGNKCTHSRSEDKKKLTNDLFN
ncbi:hypothetical protein TNIN_78521 [Trichonephila inaurata madagascariensis]|uniref:Uncharacterized protein n=1 Tax=Trichonephila inaurata madagascariensis TaxID=2747483 RepID=A0A8X6JQ14_9ARAC|nr:hypothetical protein TNIN_78521 [Trichonephila inaurata madagascariensis]